MLLRQVGVVKSPLKEPSLVAESGDLSRKRRALRAKQRQDVVSEIVIAEAFTGILDEIEDFSHCLVLYWAHRVPHMGRSLVKAHPMGRKDLPLVGIFATCSPARPNPLCATVVRLLEHRGNLLTVRGLDAIDGSPIIDIKPYNPSYYPVGEVKIPPWLERIHRELAADSPPDTREGQSGKPSE
ncbi:MAG: tRNA (N6-threonylcarbamoyladenosine(37)-N6)-methyltransferase TrmO [Deltaproteobacteria bacterium]|nr:tRNA (N6-threonylcarbamoyladenosine(37)-N6)-methyltransferase TrmO [Deltaproteobacteria bacterium]